MSYPDIHLDFQGDAREVAVIRITRGAKLNALNDGLVLSIRRLFRRDHALEARGLPL